MNEYISDKVDVKEVEKVKIRGKQRKWNSNVAMIDEEGYLNPKQMRIFLRECRVHDRDYLLFNLLARTGRRISEILALKVKDFDWEEKTLRVHVLKKFEVVEDKNGQRTTRPRDYVVVKPIDNYSAKILNEWIIKKELGAEDKIFNIGRRRADQICKKYGKKCGIYYIGKSKIHCHHFRHSWIINLYNNTKDLGRISKMIDHSSIKVTEFYTRFGHKEYRELLEEGNAKYNLI